MSRRTGLGSISSVSVVSRFSAIKQGALTYDGQGRLQPDLTLTSAFGKAELLMNVDGVGPPRFEQVVTKWPQAGQYERPVWPSTCRPPLTHGWPLDLGSRR
jgi:hypothetical protein